MLWLLLIIIALAVIFYFYSKSKSTVIGDYETVVGYENTPKIKKIVEKAKSQKPNMTNSFILSNIAKYNMQDQIESDYWMAAAINFALNDPDAVNEPITPELVLQDQPFIVPTGRLDQITTNIDKLQDYYHRTVPNDPQNVHDSNLQAHIREKYFKLAAESKPADISDLKQICQGRGSAGTLTRATQVIDKIENEPSYMDALKATDYDVLSLVWGRFKEKDIPATTLIQSLENCKAEGHIICTVGRVSNIIDSLTFLDGEVEPVATLPMLRKDALADAYKLINELPEQQKKIYEGEDSEQREELCVELSKQIETLIKQQYGDKVKNPEHLDKIIMDAQAGIS